MKENSFGGNRCRKTHGQKGGAPSHGEVGRHGKGSVGRNPQDGR